MREREGERERKRERKRESERERASERERETETDLTNHEIIPNLSVQNDGKMRQQPSA